MRVHGTLISVHDVLRLILPEGQYSSIWGRQFKQKETKPTISQIFENVQQNFVFPGFENNKGPAANAQGVMQILFTLASAKTYSQRVREKIMEHQEMLRQILGQSKETDQFFLSLLQQQQQQENGTQPIGTAQERKRKAVMVSSPQSERVRLGPHSHQGQSSGSSCPNSSALGTLENSLSSGGEEDDSSLSMDDIFQEEAERQWERTKELLKRFGAVFQE